MTHRFLHYKNSRISYYHFGNGAKQVICFHGYAEEAKLYAFLEKHAGDQYTFYSIDLPFHGNTEWENDAVFTSTDLQAIIRDIIADNNNTLETTDFKYSLVGFSLGGRIALSLYQSNPENIEKIILLAPDGLKINFWYWLSTQTWPGNKLFSFSMKHPGWFFAFLRALNKLGWVNASIFKFVNFYIGNEEARRLLYQRWTGLRKLKPDLRRIKTFIREYRTPTRLIYGKYDRIILPVRGEKFQKGIEEYCTLTIINSGHQVVHENHVNQILPALLH